MFLFDLKDFRKFSDMDVPVTEDGLLSVLEEAGVDFKEPLSIRFRIKDMDRRGIVAKNALVDNIGCEFRLSIYIPPVGSNITELTVEQIGNYLEVLNAQVRHQCTHIAQFRRPGGTGDHTEKEMQDMEAEANMNALSGAAKVVPWLYPKGEAPFHEDAPEET